MRNQLNSIDSMLLNRIYPSLAWEIKDHRKSLGSKLRIYLGHSRATFSCCVKSSIEQEKAACFWTDLYLSTPNWPSAPPGAMHSHLQFFIFGCQPISSQHAKGLVLLLFLSDVKGSHSPIDFFMSPGWRSDHGLAARRPNAQHMQRRENWEEMFPKSNL